MNRRSLPGENPRKKGRQYIHFPPGFGKRKQVAKSIERSLDKEFACRTKAI